MVRPEQIRLGGADARGVVATVQSYEYYGHDAVVRVRPERTGLPDLVVRVTGGAPIEPGRRVGLSVLGTVVVWPREAPSRGFRPNNALVTTAVSSSMHYSDGSEWQRRSGIAGRCDGRRRRTPCRGVSWAAGVWSRGDLVPAARLLGPYRPAAAHGGGGQGQWLPTGLRLFGRAGAQGDQAIARLRGLPAVGPAGRGVPAGGSGLGPGVGQPRLDGNQLGAGPLQRRGRRSAGRWPGCLQHRAAGGSGRGARCGHR